MVAQNAWNVLISNQIDDPFRLRSVPHVIAQTNHPVYGGLIDIRQDLSESFKVAVDV